MSLTHARSLAHSKCRCCKPKLLPLSGIQRHFESAAVATWTWKLVETHGAFQGTGPVEAKVATNHPRNPLDAPTSPNLLDESRIHHYKEHLKGPAHGRNMSKYPNNSVTFSFHIRPCQMLRQLDDQTRSQAAHTLANMLSTAHIQEPAPRQSTQANICRTGGHPSASLPPAVAAKLASLASLNFHPKNLCVR